MHLKNCKIITECKQYISQSNPDTHTTDMTSGYDHYKKSLILVGCTIVIQTSTPNLAPRFGALGFRNEQIHEVPPYHHHRVPLRTVINAKED